MFVHLRFLAILGLLLLPYAIAQRFNNASSTHITLSTSFRSTITPSPSTTRNSSSSEGYLQSCNSAWQSYKSNIKFAYETESFEYTGPPITSTSYLGVQTCSSYCGSICYADNKTITGTAFITETYPNIQYSEVTRLTYSEPAPNCTIPATDCKQLWSSYTSAQASWESDLTDPAGTWSTIPPTPVTPGCTVGCSRTTCAFGGGNKGVAPTPGVVERLYNSLQLYYFPETRNVSRDMCAYTPSQGPVPLRTGDPVSSYIPTTTDGFVVVDGKTFYKGNVYISISQMEVFDNCGWSTVMEDVAFPVASSDVQSERADVDQASRFYDINWADFNEPIPYSAYAGGLSRTFSTDDGAYWSDHDNYCKTAVCARTAVYPGGFHPYIVLPQAVKNIDPAFAGCDIPYDLSFFDPPIALHGVANFLTTASPDPVVTPAKPASSVSALPIQTAEPADPPFSNHPTSADPAPIGSATPQDPPSSGTTPGGQIPGNPASSDPGPDPLADHPTSAGSTNQSPASGSPGTDSPEPGVSSGPHPTRNGNAPGASQSTAPAEAARPHITAGPTIIPIAPDGQGLILHSSTAIASSESAVIGGTTFHLQSGVLTLVSSGGISSIALGGLRQNGVGTVVGLQSGGALTITTAGDSLVFDVETTLENGDPAQTLEDEVLTVVSDGVRISNIKNGQTTSIAFVDIESAYTGQGGSDVASPYNTGDPAYSTRDPASDAGSAPTTTYRNPAASSYSTGDPASDAVSAPTTTNRNPVALIRSSGRDSGSADLTTTPSASGSGSEGSNQHEGSETSGQSSSTSRLNEGSATLLHIPWHLWLLSMCILILHL